MCRRVLILAASLVIALVLAASVWFLVNAQSCDSETCQSPRYRSFIPAVMIGGGGAAEAPGNVVDESGVPMGYGAVRLAEVFCTPAGCVFILDLAFSPGSFISQDGSFRVQNATPGRYVVCVGLGDSSKWQVISTPELVPIVWVMQPGVNDLGTLSVWRSELNSASIIQEKSTVNLSQMEVR